jgi:hypothetical protein
VEEARHFFIFGGRRGIILLEGSEASPVPTADKGIMKAKRLRMVKSSGFRQGLWNFDFLN